jgi:hypothetical protein
MKNRDNWPFRHYNYYYTGLTTYQTIAFDHKWRETGNSATLPYINPDQLTVSQLKELRPLEERSFERYHHDFEEQLEPNGNLCGRFDAWYRENAAFWPGYATGDDIPLSVEYPQIRELYRSKESGK